MSERYHVNITTRILGEGGREKEREGKSAVGKIVNITIKVKEGNIKYEYILYLNLQRSLVVFQKD